MKKIAIVVISMAFAAFAVAGDLESISTASSVPLKELKSAKRKGLEFEYDQLKGSYIIRASDESVFDRNLTTMFTKSLQFSYISDLDEVKVTVYHHEFGYLHTFYTKAEIYVGKTLAMTLKDAHDAFSISASGSDQLVEHFSSYVPAALAKTVSQADPSQITIRFYSKAGYSDATPKKRGKARFSELFSLIESIRE